MKTINHQQITPVTDEVAADNGLAFLKYQQALIFVHPKYGAFNSITVLLMGQAVQMCPSGSLFIPNITSRPVLVEELEWPSLQRQAVQTYREACTLYFREEAIVREDTAKKFETPLKDTESLEVQVHSLSDQ